MPLEPQWSPGDLLRKLPLWGLSYIILCPTRMNFSSLHHIRFLSLYPPGDLLRKLPLWGLFYYNFVSNQNEFFIPASYQNSLIVPAKRDQIGTPDSVRDNCMLLCSSNGYCENETEILSSEGSQACCDSSTPGLWLCHRKSRGLFPDALTKHLYGFVHIALLS